MTAAILLSAGYGRRLEPLTLSWPKCLMPIHGRPLLEHWIFRLRKAGIENFLVNTHYKSDEVDGFLNRPGITDMVTGSFESELLGTCGTLRHNSAFCSVEDVFVAHADNWCICDFSAFIGFHHSHDNPITMMTFRSNDPQSCGIVETDHFGVVQSLEEKPLNPRSNLANAAVYIFNKEVFEWLKQNPECNDISLDLLPHFIGKISTWHNNQIHRDIGTYRELMSAQKDEVTESIPSLEDEWQLKFQLHPIHKMIRVK